MTSRVSLAALRFSVTLAFDNLAITCPSFGLDFAEALGYTDSRRSSDLGRVGHVLSSRSGAPRLCAQWSCRMPVSSLFLLLLASGMPRGPCLRTRSSAPSLPQSSAARHVGPSVSRCAFQLQNVLFLSFSRLLSLTGVPSLFVPCSPDFLYLVAHTRDTGSGVFVSQFRCVRLFRAGFCIILFPSAENVPYAQVFAHFVPLRDPDEEDDDAG